MYRPQKGQIKIYFPARNYFVVSASIRDRCFADIDNSSICFLNRESNNRFDIKSTLNRRFWKHTDGDSTSDIE